MFILYAETEIKEVTRYLFLVRLLHELKDKKIQTCLHVTDFGKRNYC